MPTGHDLHVAELAGDPEPAAHHLAVDEDRSPDAGAEGDHDDVRLLARCPEPPLGVRRSVGVVVDEQRRVDAFGQPVAQRLAPPGEVRREDDGGPVGRDEPRRADPHGDDRLPVHVGEQLLDDVDDGVLDDARPGAPVRGVPSGAPDDATLGVDEAAGDLRATDVDPDGETGPVRCLAHGYCSSSSSTSMSTVRARPGGRGSGLDDGPAPAPAARSRRAAAAAAARSASRSMVSG